MPQFVFDTDHLTLYQHKHPPLMQRLSQQPADAVAICPINIEETMRGRLAVLARVLSGMKHVQASCPHPQGRAPKSKRPCPSLPISSR